MLQVVISSSWLPCTSIWSPLTTSKFLTVGFLNYRMIVLLTGCQRCYISYCCWWSLTIYHLWFLYYFTSCTIFHDSGDAYHPLHIFSHSLAHVILNDMFLDHHKTHICRSVFAISVPCNCNNVGNKGTSLLTSSFQSLLACCPHHIVDKQRIQNSAKRCFLRTVGSCHTSFLCSPLAACSSSNWLQVGCDMSWLFLWLSSVPLNVYYPSR